MTVIIKRNTGQILCAAMYKKEKGGVYIDDALHYYLSAEKKILITDIHHLQHGEWWVKGEEPKDVTIDEFYYE